MGIVGIAGLVDELSLQFLHNKGVRYILSVLRAPHLVVSFCHLSGFPLALLVLPVRDLLRYSAYCTRDTGEATVRSIFPP